MLLGHLKLYLQASRLSLVNTPGRELAAWFEFPEISSSSPCYKLYENARILKSLPKSLWCRAPCAFISKEVELQKYKKRLGYHVLGSAHIPPQNLDLPSSKKAS
jgi:hypothetical protein